VVVVCRPATWNCKVLYIGFAVSFLDIVVWYSEGIVDYGGENIVSNETEHQALG
jgi:hypothetical protein